jgi:MFS family permease
VKTSLVRWQTRSLVCPVQSRAEAWWPALFRVVTCGWCAFLNLYATQPLLPSFVASFRCSKWEVTLTVSATSLAIALTAPIIGRLSDKVGRKAVIIPAIFLLIVPTLSALVCCPLSPSNRARRGPTPTL